METQTRLKMLKKIVCRISIVLFICLLSSAAHAKDLKTDDLPADNLPDLFKQVSKLKLERHGYILGKALNSKQVKIAEANPVEATTKGTFKFKDNHLFVVAQEKTNRVIVMYEQFEEAPRQKIQDLIGDLFMNFDDPTVLAHDTVVYWAYKKEKKITSEQFEKARKEKTKLGIIASIKLMSEIKITEKTKEPSKGQFYYIISSNPILEFF
jgi:hypothetical protein